MAAWWSPLGDGVRRLVGRGAAPAADPPSAVSESSDQVPVARPPQAWPWQPPLQRAVDPAWEPRLRPDDFAAGLTSHQDPTFRRDLVHEVHPEVGGLADGLADVAAGWPRTSQPTTGLTVRPVRTTRPAVQRTLASFAAGTAGDELTTVRVERPRAAEPAGPVAPIEAATSAERVSSPEPTPTVGARTVLSVPSTTAEVPTLRGSTVDVQRALPVVAAPPPRTRPAELPVARSLPVLQRSAGTSLPGPPAAPRPSESGPVLRSDDVVGPATSTSTSTAEPKGATAPLSGFVDAIEQLSVQPAAEARTEHLPEPLDEHSFEHPAEHPADSAGAVVGPVVPGPRPPAAPPVSAAVQRDLAQAGPSLTVPSLAAPSSTSPASTTSPSAGPVVLQVEPASGSTGEVSIVVPGAPVVPLVGSTAGPSAAEPAGGPALQRASYDDLPVVPVARDEPSGAGVPDVPRIFVAPGPSPSVSPVTEGGPAGDVPAIPLTPLVARAASAPMRAGAEPLVVARVALPPQTPPQTSRPTTPRTAPLTGARPSAVQRAGLDQPTDVTASLPEPARPLRFEGVGVPASPASSGPSGTVATGPPPVPAAVQRSGPGLPVVAPGLTGPAPAASWPASTAAVELLPGGRGDGAAGSSDAYAPTYAPVHAPAPVPAGPADRAVQRLAGPLPVASVAADPAPAGPVPVRALPFDQMFRGGDRPVGAPAWTTVDLPVVGEAMDPVQRAVDTTAITTAPVAPEPVAPEPAPAPGPDASAQAPSTAPAAPGTTAPAGADLDELARRLFDPLSARLRAELWLDRERAGLVADAHF